MLSVREIESSDIEHICDYWLNASPAALKDMGVDFALMPDRDSWRKMLQEQIETPIQEKRSYCMIWLIDGQPVGHCNVNKIIFGLQAYMHLHLWKKDERSKGTGRTLIQMTLPWFFERLELWRIRCEPYAANPAPNKILAKTGFQFVKTWRTKPGWLNFEQEVNLWDLTREQWKKLKL